MSKYLDPRRYVAWAVRKAVFSWHGSRYDEEAFRNGVTDQFLSCGFDYDAAIRKLNEVRATQNRPAYDDRDGMASIHWVLFAALSLSSSCRRILEIGTYDGETAGLLASLFPQAEIVTVDLPEDDPILQKTYHRDNDLELQAFREKQRRNLAAANIRHVQRNSFFLPGAVEGKFDLIWVDGGHLYPEVAWDICNAYHRINPDGWLMMDDVMTDPKADGDDYVGPESYQVMEYVRHRADVEVNYFLKRFGPVWSANPRQRKFVGLMKRTESAAV